MTYLHSLMLPLNGIYHWVFPSRIGLPPVSVTIAIWTNVAPGTGLSVAVPSCRRVVVLLAPPLVCSWGRRDVLPGRCTVLLTRVGRRGVVALVGGLGWLGAVLEQWEVVS